MSSPLNVEAHNDDFFGLPSSPMYIYHTGPAWLLPSGPQAQRVPKEARPVCSHPISSVWDELGEKIHKFFDSVNLKWTSIDITRFAETRGLGEPSPLFIWVGVLPGTLSPDDAKGPAEHCKQLLLESGINDVEIAFRESIYTQYAGPNKLLGYIPSVDPTVDGTSCIYICEGGGSDRIFLFTARHVVLLPSKHSNELYERNSEDNTEPPIEIIHIGSKAFQNALEAIRNKIDFYHYLPEGYQEELASLGAPTKLKGQNLKTILYRQEITQRLNEAQTSGASVSEFHRDITGSWSVESQRILGHVVYAPPISVGTFDWNTFRGNVIHLGKLPRHEFMKKMYPNPETRAESQYPPGGLMPLRNIATYNKIHYPTTVGKNGEAAIIVIKNGTTTGLTFGRATGIHSTSMEMAAYSYSEQDGAFPAPGDSGSVVVDGDGDIVGMIVGGAGKPEQDAADVTYVSVYAFLDERIKQVFPHSYLFPTQA